MNNMNDNDRLYFVDGGENYVKSDKNGVVSSTNDSASVDDNSTDDDDSNSNVTHKYLRGFASVVDTINSVVYGSGDDDSRSSSEYGVYGVYGIFTVVWLLTWCIVGLLLSKVFKRVKRGCFN